ncbi:MAG: cysteine desulfurase [Verrucomicrobia subdivision 3 bacterium]|nr:cysteine desulfurase [Limisphaerales bacterium]
MLYFDHNATTPLLPQAREAWLEAVEKYVGNPSSPHRIGSRADMLLQTARVKLANYLGCDPLDIVWTSGATESNNMVLHHLARALPGGAEVWISAIEHPCVLNATAHYFEDRFRLIPVDRSGVIDIDWLHEELPKEPPGLVAVMAANNETGVLQPWQHVLDFCREWNVPVFCDAAQWLGKMPARSLGACEFVSGCAHKFGGPKGIGFLKVNGKFHSLLFGGRQEEGRRPGTENVAGVAAMLAALEAREHSLALNEQRVRLGWRKQFERQLLSHLSGVTIVGENQERLWNTVSVVMPQADCQQRWVVKMDRHGYAVSTGSACASGKEQPSHVLAAMGYSPAEAGRVLRFSAGWETTEADWKTLLEGVLQVASQLEKVTGQIVESSNR